MLFSRFAPLFLIFPLVAKADDFPEVKLTIKAAHFYPEKVEVPAHQKVKLLVTNEGPGAEEFESSVLNREKIVPPGKTVTVFLDPLSPGEYSFFGDFHRDTAKGVVVAKETSKDASQSPAKTSVKP